MLDMALLCLPMRMLGGYDPIGSTGLSVMKNKRDKRGAETAPLQANRGSPWSDAMLAEAIRNGWLTPPALPSRSPPPRKPVTTARKLMHELQRDREDR